MLLSSDNYKCWEIDEKDFPKNGNVSEKIKFILSYGILAPSTFNSQPWKCKITGNKLDIFLDRNRITEKSDKSERFAHISIGAFLENILIASNYFGLKNSLKFTTHTKKTKLQHVASISFTKGKGSKNDLFSAIKKRTTNRSPSKNKKIDEKILKEIANIKEKNIKLKILDENNKEEIIDISKLGDFNIWSDIDFRKEHVVWVRTNLTKKYDGMPGFGVNAGLIPSFLARPVILSPIFPKFQSLKNTKALKSTKSFIVIVSEESFNNWIRVGMIFERITLKLSAKGISVSPMGQFIEDSEARSRLQKLIKLEKGYGAQVFFRIGYATLHVPHSPRFPVDKVLI